jgi:rhamnosyltransferase
VSIVLPTRNGAAMLPALLDAIRSQRVDFPFELVAVDSASTDGSRELLRERTDRLIEIPAASFDHGLTRNLGIGHARGELIVLMVQDALPVSDGWLKALTAPLIADHRLAGVFARQIPRPDASPITRYYHARWVAASEVPDIRSLAGAAEFERLAPMDRFLRCTFDNVCSAIRRSVWMQHPFKPTPIGEDLEWARDVLMAGYRLAYEPAAQVVHSHDRSAGYELARTCVLHRRLYELFGLRTVPTIRALGRAAGSSLVLHWRCRNDGGPFAPGRAVALAVAWPLGQYLGALSAVRGWKPFRTRMV